MLISSNYYFQTQFTSAGKYMNILIKQNTIQILFNLIVLWNFKESKHYIKTNFVTFPKRLATTDFHLLIFFIQYCYNFKNDISYLCAGALLRTNYSAVDILCIFMHPDNPVAATAAHPCPQGSPGFFCLRWTSYLASTFSRVVTPVTLIH